MQHHIWVMGSASELFVFPNHSKYFEFNFYKKLEDISKFRIKKTPRAILINDETFEDAAWRKWILQISEFFNVPVLVFYKGAIVPLTVPPEMVDKIIYILHTPGSKIPILLKKILHIDEPVSSLSEEIDYKSLFESGVRPQLVLNYELLILNTSLPVTEKLGRARDELVGCSFPALLHPDNESAFKNAIQKKLSYFRGRIIGKRQSWQQCELHLKYNGKRNNIILIEIIRTEEEQKILEELQQSNELFQALANSTASAIFIHQGDYFVYANKKALELTGYSFERMKKMKFWEIIHPDFVDIVRERGIKRQRNEEIPNRYEFKIVSKSGEERWVDLTATAIQFNGKPAVLGTAFDITVRKNAELNIARLETYYRLLLENNFTMIFLLRKDYSIKYTTPSVAETLGYSARELQGMPLNKILASPDMVEPLGKIINNTSDRTLQMQFRKKDGSEIRVEVKAKNLHHIKEIRGIILTARNVTDEYKVKTALSESEQKYRQLVESSPNGILIHSDGIIRYANPLAHSILKIPAHESLVGLPVNLFFTTDLRDHTKENPNNLQEALNSRQHEQIIYNRIKKPVPVELNSTGIRYEGKQAEMIVFRDISARKKAEEGLKYAFNIEKSLSDISQFFFTDSNPLDGVSEKICRMFDCGGCFIKIYTNPFTKSEDTKTWIHPQYKISEEHIRQLMAIPDATVERILKQGKLVIRNISTVRKVEPDYKKPLVQSGVKSSIILPIYAPSGILIGLTGIGNTQPRKWHNIDIRTFGLITRMIGIYIERRATKNEINLLAHAVMSSNEGIGLTDRDYKITFANRTILHLLGRQEKDIIGTSIFDYLDDSRSHDALTKFREKGHEIPFQAELDAIVLNDIRFPVFISSSPIKNADNETEAILFIVQDISLQKQAQQALIDSEEKYRIVVEGSLNGIYIVQNNKFTFVNSRFSSMFGYKQFEILHKLSPWDVIHEDDHFKLNKIYDVRKSGTEQAVEIELKAIRKNGEIFPVKVLSSTRTFRGKNVVIGTILDISREKVLEEQLVQAQKLESVGTLAGGIAHDFNNLLGTILGYASLLKMEAKTDSTVYEFSDIIELTAQRGGELTTQLLAFSRSGKQQLKRVNINKMIHDTIKMVSRTFIEDIRISTSLEEQLPEIQADPGKIQQVFLNLMLNARDAMPEGGELFIQSGITSVDEDHINALFDAVPGDYIFVTVRDTGMGMEKSTLKRIYEPFFTTKSKDRGTGLGLAVVFGIIKSHQGFMEVQSSPGHGTTFTCYLPIQQIEMEPQPTVKPELKKGSATILVIDDEASLRGFMEHGLKHYNYKVISARDGLEGIITFENKQDSIQLILLDLILPKITGEEVFHKIRKIDPNIPVLFITGFSNSAQVRNLLKYPHTSLVEKPFTVQKLVEKVQEILSHDQ